MIDNTLQIEDYKLYHNTIITLTKMIKYYEIIKLKNKLYF